MLIYKYKIQDIAFMESTLYDSFRNSPDGLERSLDGSFKKFTDWFERSLYGSFKKFTDWFQRSLDGVHIIWKSFI